jgi:phosphatidylglycerol:prolipoprotein diacylglycerol transferase
VHPTAVQIGPLSIHWYGVLVALGFLSGLWTAGRRAVHGGIPAEKIVDLGPWLIVGSIVGARSLYVVSYWREQFAGGPFWEIFMVHHGGLVFYGGLLGASLACIVYVRIKRLPPWKVADILAPSIALGYVAGRIGCLMNGCCYGRPCDLPWAIRFPIKSFAWDQQHAAGLVGEHDPALPVHPTQIYDALLSLGLYLALAWLCRRKRFDGQVFAAYLLGYAVLRSVVEFFRGDYPQYYFGGWVTPAQLVSVWILLAGLILYWILPRSKL